LNAVEVNNECNIRYDRDTLKPQRVHESIERVQRRTRNGRRLLVDTSYGGGDIRPEQCAESHALRRECRTVLYTGLNVGGEARRRVIATRQ
jgi:hypothetical protein